MDQYGKKVNQFEKNISKFTNVKYVVAMNNGTSTLDALLTALDISKDDEVIVPNLTYISTANVVSYKKQNLFYVIAIEIPSIQQKKK